MKVTLKNLKIADSLSEETIAFTADVHVDGRKACYVKNDGQEGCSFISIYYDKELTSIANEFYRDHFEQLTGVVDELVEEAFNAKEKEKLRKKLQRSFTKHVVWGNLQRGYYTELGFKGKHAFVDMVRTPKGKEALQRMVDRIKREELKEGEVILNDNLVALGINI